MAAVLAGRASIHALVKPSCAISLYSSKMSSYTRLSKGKKLAVALAGIATAGGASLVLALNSAKLNAGDVILHPPKLPWDHKRLFASYDAQSLRRGYQVYKSVCKTCHSLNYVYFRNFVGVFMSEAEAKAEAEEVSVMDGPDETGEMFERPGKLADKLPSPYRNDAEARYANNGALPVDLSYIVLARHGKEDYIYHLLTGYCDPPAGIQVRDGLYYNPYFTGGAIGMPQQLNPGVLDYTDGTEATVEQMAKDVVSFLAWCAEPEMDARKEMAVKFLLFMAIIIPASYYYKRFKWSTLKSRKLAFQPPR